MNNRSTIVLDAVLRVFKPAARLLLQHGVSYGALAAALKRVFLDAGTLDLAQTIELPADAVSGQSGVAVLAVDARGVAMQALALPLRDCAG